MSDEEVIESQVVKDTKLFNDWFGANIVHLTLKAEEIGLDTKIKEIMRLAWRRCSELKNKEAESLSKKISVLEKELKDKDQKYDQLHMELQKVTNKLIQAEKNARK
jgi:predicted RNase H-like nuclease (RuvC/YqgF family)